MLKFTITNAKGESETIDLANEGFHTIYGKLYGCGIDCNPYRCKLKDIQGDERVKIHSDSDFGNAAIKILRGNDTLWQSS